MKLVSVKRAEAFERAQKKARYLESLGNEVWATNQLAKLDTLLGIDIGASKERKQLKKMIS